MSDSEPKVQMSAQKIDMEKVMIWGSTESIIAVGEARNGTVQNR